MRTLNLASLAISVLLISQSSFAFFCSQRNPDGTCPVSQQSAWENPYLSQSDTDHLQNAISSRQGIFANNNNVKSSTDFMKMMPGPLALANLGFNWLRAKNSNTPQVRREAIENIAVSLSNVCPPTRAMTTFATFNLAFESNDLSTVELAQKKIKAALAFNIAAPIPSLKMPPALLVIQAAVIEILELKKNGELLSENQNELVAGIRNLQGAPTEEQLDNLSQIIKTEDESPVTSSP